MTQGDETEQTTVTFERPYGGSYLSPFWYAWLPSEACAKDVASRSLLLKVQPAQGLVEPGSVEW